MFGFYRANKINELETRNSFLEERIDIHQNQLTIIDGKVHDLTIRLDGIEELQSDMSQTISNVKRRLNIYNKLVLLLIPIGGFFGYKYYKLYREIQALKAKVSHDPTTYDKHFSS